MKRPCFFCTALALALLLTACAPTAATAPAELAVFAAASLLEPLNKLGSSSSASIPRAVTFNFAASNQLVQQMASGAQADVFASASLAQMLAVEKSVAV